MTGQTDRPRRIRWLDGVRGLATIQVVLLHSAFVLVLTIGQLDPIPIRYE